MIKLFCKLNPAQPNFDNLISPTTHNLPQTKSPTTIHGISWKGGVYMKL